MSHTGTVEYPQGARQTFGPQDVEHVKPAVYNHEGPIVTIVQPVVYDDLPAADTQDNLTLKIPANSFIVSARLYVTTDFDSTSGTTPIDFGLQQDDGTEIDNDGFVVDLVADGSNAGWAVGAGALVGASIGSVDGQIVVTEGVGDLEAGEGFLLVEYIPPVS